MDVAIGTTRISRQQRSLLRGARDWVRRRGMERRVAQALETVLTDEDIVSGRESLHPDWISVLRDGGEALQLRLAPPIRELALHVMSRAVRDPGLEEIDPRTASLAFLLGAGASKPEPSGIPTVQELLPDLLERARRLDRRELSQLADFCDDARITNIEDLLTAAQLATFCSRSPQVLRLLDYLLHRQRPEPEAPVGYRRVTRSIDLSSVAFLQDTLQILFGLLSSRMLPARPNEAHKSIAEYAALSPGTAIVTSNYDCCIDLALGDRSVAFSYCVEAANVPSGEESEDDTRALLKLHGSLNWFYCETCQQVHMLDIEKVLEEYLDDRNYYPVIAVCRQCGGQRRGLVVPPLAVKFDIHPPLNPLLERAQRAFDGADIVVVVGFSFSDADTYIRRMLSKSMQTAEDMRIVVFDPDYGVVDRIRDQFSTRIPGFQVNRILRVEGDCSVTIPQFLSGEFAGSESSEDTAEEASVDLAPEG